MVQHNAAALKLSAYIELYCIVYYGIDGVSYKKALCHILLHIIYVYVT